MRNLLLLFACLITLSNCLVEPQTSTPANDYFFNLDSYLNEEIEVLRSRKNLRKTTMINGVKETSVIEEVNFEEELRIFTESDINRTAWMDRYQVDSTYNQASQLSEISYTALDEDLRTRKMIIQFDNGKVENIFIRNASKNIITDSEQLLNYSPDKGYRISSRQKVIFSPESKLAVEVTFP